MKRRLCLIDKKRPHYNYVVQSYTNMHMFSPSVWFRALVGVLFLCIYREGNQGRPWSGRARLHFYRENSSPFPSFVYSRQTVHSHAARRYLLVNFCARKSPSAGFELTQSTLVTRLNHYLRGGGMVVRTHDRPKNPYIPLFLHTKSGPDYCVPP